MSTPAAVATICLKLGDVGRDLFRSRPRPDQAMVFDPVLVDQRRPIDRPSTVVSVADLDTVFRVDLENLVALSLRSVSSLDWGPLLGLRGNPDRECYC